MYEPDPIPEQGEPAEMLRAVYWELQRIANELNTGVSAVVLPELNAAPAKLTDGMIVLADGVNWNPGSGAGYYGYHSGAWTFLG